MPDGFPRVEPVGDVDPAAEYDLLACGVEVLAPAGWRPEGWDEDDG